MAEPGVSRGLEVLEGRPGRRRTTRSTSKFRPRRRRRFCACRRGAVICARRRRLRIVVVWRTFPRGRSQVFPVVRTAFPRGDNEDLNVRAPRDGQGGWSPVLNVRVPADGPGRLLPGCAVWSGGAKGATQEEGREPRQHVRACAACVAREAGVWRNLEEPRHGVHAMVRDG